MRFVLALLVIASCDRFVHRSTPDAGETVVSLPTSTTTTPNASVTPEPSDAGFLGLHIPGEEEEEPLVVDAGGTCPLEIHPNYCRRRCKTFVDRQTFRHARRIAHPTRSGLGKCDGYDVFAEDDATGGIVEYYDHATSQLLGVTDSRLKPCGTYGKVPTCGKLDVKWEAPRGGGLGDIRK